MAQRTMATLYNVSVLAMNQSIDQTGVCGFRSGTDSVIKIYLVTAIDAKRYWTNDNNLQMIIAVGFKVNVNREVQFRKGGE